MRPPLPGYLEVEIGTFCNRRCAWCPNSTSTRGRQRRSMDDGTWRALLADLRRARYRGLFAFHNYNEPLADPRLLERIADVTAALPRARLELHTNGDLLDGRRLEALRRAGVGLVRVTLYPSARTAFAEPDPARAHRFLAQLGLTGRLRRKRSKLEVAARLGSLELVVRLPRIERYSNRAGAVRLAALASGAPRTTPCLLPLHSAAVDVDGRLKLCCHVYDASTPESAPAVVGNVREVPFTTLWRSARLEALRRRLAAGDFAGLPCASCTHRAPRWLARAMTPRARQLLRGRR